MAARFLLDEHISPRVAKACRARAVDAQSVADAGLLGADDGAVFRRAIGDDRIVVTYNTADYALLLPDMFNEFGRIPGLVFVDGRTIPTSDIRGQAGALVKLARAIESGDVDVSGGLFLTR